MRVARRRADVVIASLHWGIEYDPHPPTARQRALARTALRAGAAAVIGAHPHVLQPIARPGGHRVVVYSLGNFVFTPRNAWAARTGVLELRLSARGVERAHLRRARIVGVQPASGARNPLAATRLQTSGDQPVARSCAASASRPRGLAFVGAGGGVTPFVPATPPPRAETPGT